MHSCVQSKDGPKIPKHDLLKMFSYAENKVISQRESLLHNAAVKPIKDVIETALDFGGCVKDCFVNKNQNGFCFDRKGYVFIIVFVVVKILILSYLTRSICGYTSDVNH